MVYDAPMDDDILTDAEKQVLPAVVRVSFPVADLPSSAYADLADALRQLANAYETAYRDFNMTAGREKFTESERHRRMGSAFSLELLRNSVKAISFKHGTVIREGRPSNCNTAGQSGNRWETTANQTVSFPQQIVSGRR